jgi:hypothetical protein
MPDAKLCAGYEEEFGVRPWFGRSETDTIEAQRARRVAFDQYMARVYGTTVLELPKLGPFSETRTEPS